jgi:hypothetical protein
VIVNVFALEQQADSEFQGVMLLAVESPGGLRAPGNWGEPERVVA